MKGKLSPRVLYGLVAGGLLVYALFGWFVVVGPKRARVSEIEKEVAAAQTAVTSARAAAAVKDDAQPIAVADLFRLAKAMPAVPDMPGILLEFSRIAQETGITFQSISPAASTTAGTYQQVPITVSFDGNFYELSDFLFRLRTLVGVKAGELHAQGRLYSVETVDFAEAATGFPDLTATLGLTAFVYGTSVPATDVPPTAEAAPAGGATTPPATTETTTSNSEASAAEVSP